MAIFSVAQVNAWLDPTKAVISSLETETASAAEQHILASLETRFDTSTWTTTGNTPELVQICTAMYYAGNIYRRSYSEDLIGGTDNYGDQLMEDATNLLRGILDGGQELRDLADYKNPDEPLLYPNNTSTTLYDTDPRNKDATPQVFAMNQVF